MTVKTKTWILLPVCLLISRIPLHPGTWYVYPGIENSGTGSSWEQAMKTIPEALTACMPGDILLIGYDETGGTQYLLVQGLHLDRPVKMRSARFGKDLSYDTAQSDASLCILDGQNTCRPVLIFPQPEAYSSLSDFTEFIGFTVKNGNATHEIPAPGRGGGICVMGNTRPLISQCLITGNTASSSSEQPGKGGGLFCSGSGSLPYFGDCTLRDNCASRGNEGMGGGVCAADSSGPAFFNCVIDSNTASLGSMNFPGFGGGLCALGDSTRPVIYSSIIMMNLASEQAAGYGGGIAFLEGASGSLSGSQIQENTASISGILNGMGGGILCSGKNTDPVLRENIVFHNHASIRTRGYGGGLGIFENASPSVLNNEFKTNTASESQGGFGGGIACGSGTQSVIENNQIDENTASVQASGYGGGLYFSEDAFAICKGNTLTRNIASLSSLDLGMGGGICLEHATEKAMHIVLEQNRFEENTASTRGSGQGGALAISGTGPLIASVLYNSFLSNVAASGSERFGLGGAIYLYGLNNETVIRNNFFKNNLEDSTAHPEGRGCGLYMNTLLSDTSIRNNLWMNSGTTSEREFLFSAQPCSVTHNAFYGNPVNTNDLIRSLFEVNGDPIIDPVTLIPRMDSPLVDAGYDPVIVMDERASGWALDIGIREFTGTLVEKECASGQEIRFAGQVRAGLSGFSFDEPVHVTIEVHPRSRHPMDSHGLPRWYHIGCDPSSEGEGDLILSYIQEDCRSLDEHSLKLWHFDTRLNIWQGPFFTVRDTSANWIRAPFSDLAGDWIITDAKDMNALHATVFNMTAISGFMGIRIEWSVTPPSEILSMSVWRTDDGEHFTELEGLILQADPEEEEYSYTDSTVKPEQAYQYKIKLNYLNGLSEFSPPLSSSAPAIPEETRLLPNVPNPFNHETRFYYQLSESGSVSFEIRDIRGRLIDSLVRKLQTPGCYMESWDGKDSSGKPVGSGIYIYCLKTPSYEKTGKMMMLR